MIATPASTDRISRPLDGVDGHGARAQASLRAVASSAWRRLRLGDVTVDVSIQDGSEPALIAVKPNMVVVVFAGDRPAELSANGLAISIAPGGAALLTRAEPFSIAWGAAAGGVVAHLPKARFQVLVGRSLGAPVRIGAGQVVLAGLSRDTALGVLVAEVACAAQSPSALVSERALDLGRRFHEGVAQIMGARPEGSAILLPAKSVARAINHIQARLETNVEIDPAAIAAAAGVTPRTIREGFRACLGVSMSVFVQNARLERARARLCSGHDLRAMQDVARETGFKSASSFTRAYVRAFREAPTETRARGVRQAGSR